MWLVPTAFGNVVCHDSNILHMRKLFFYYFKCRSSNFSVIWDNYVSAVEWGNPLVLHLNISKNVRPFFFFQVYNTFQYLEKYYEGLWPISGQCSVSIPSEYFRKLEVSNDFTNRKRTLAWNVITHLSSMHPFSTPWKGVLKVRIGNKWVKRDP